MKASDVERAIRSGAATTGEIASHVDGVSDRSHVARELKRMVDDGDLDRQPHPDGNGYIYLLSSDDEESKNEMRVVGDRDYDWQRLVPPLDAAT